MTASTSTTAGTRPTPTTISVSGIAVGDTISVEGIVSGTSVTATKIMDGMMVGWVDTVDMAHEEQWELSLQSMVTRLP